MPETLYVKADELSCRYRDIWRYDCVRCRTEVNVMSLAKQADKPAAKSAGKTGMEARVTRKPTEVLLHGRKGDERLLIIRYAQEGFYLSDVKDMLSTSTLYMEQDLVQRITGRSVRTVQRLAKETKPIRLNQQQSTVAFQYAQTLEHATNVFGSQQLAEEWLKKPCKYLDGYVPLELIDNSLGFQAVEDYLTRIEHGVYQ